MLKQGNMRCEIIENEATRAGCPSPALTNSCHFRRCEVSEFGINVYAVKPTNNVNERQIQSPAGLHSDYISANRYYEPVPVRKSADRSIKNDKYGDFPASSHYKYEILKGFLYRLEKNIYFCTPF
ncbi:hypothetical protein TBC1_12975 [Lentimicrobium saccharophilum]|uniref:Uncharacterized protein n=1 Tax=Lentimicrobium saccharophilum TaxID=1678841 RepID=A0A0S7C7F0_9BACT|nr:hypothetical protein TBC1_12975 [Lentimicrobium saccharophilum]